MSALADITGQRFDRLTALHRGKNTSAGRATWVCICDCGGVVAVPGKDLRSGNTRSCGCLQTASRAVAGEKNRRHGLTRSPTHETWCSMRSRCEKPSHKSYARYGAAGVRVCDRWQSFDAFLADMGERPAGTTIDRLDGRKGYEPGNCRWATPTEQARNMKSNRPLAAFGEAKLVVEWAEDARCVVSRAALQKRIAAGWDVERALATPKYAERRHYQAAVNA